MLRYRADIKTLIFVAIYFGLVAVQWIFAPSTLWIAIPLVAFTCLFSFLGAVATHNTVHTPVFTELWMNRIFQCVLTLTYGHPVSAYVPGHNLSHHKHTQSRRDVMRTTKVRYKWNLLNILLFMPTVVKAIFPADLRYAKAMKTRNPKWYRQQQIEWAVFLVAMAALLVLDFLQEGWVPKKFLLYVLVPHQYAAWGIISINYLQHDGTDEDSEYNGSRNFVGKIVNWIAYNNGYHTLHHMEPGLHWSLLPVEHAKRVAPFNHPNLDQKALFPYLFTNFIYPAKRLRYDGKPVVLPAEGPDEEWSGIL